MRKNKGIMIFGIIMIYCLILKYLFGVLFPFILAFLCYYIMKPLIDLLENYFHVKRSAIGISLLLVIYLLLTLLLGSLITYLFFFFADILTKLPVYYETMIEPFFQQFLITLSQQFSFFGQTDILSSIQNFLTESFFQAISSLSIMITQIPSFIFSFFLFIISTFFLVLDYDPMREKMISLCHQKVLYIISTVKQRCLISLKIYLKCQLILMFLCFLILWIGFSILRMKHPLLYAVMTALLDSLPFIGVGIVLIPMCIVFIVKGIYLKAFYLFLIYLIINVVRSLLEPQIMNKQMQIPSFLLLLSMMIHLHFFGVIGIVLSPIHMSLIYSFIDSMDSSLHKSDGLI
ncbi:AI-2E family transporter [Candidatus Stoquefichus massiliensis]|uniref:AI-2E family transporter n=1 Tax=Candidatus Stoquefichus massiliensis TaxID=1470350 RepID=UPI00048A0E45|nr:AI-2E family transporter [Candidatus Stoquefichus massiliensis]